jgi:O-antigen ligase
LGLLVVIFTTVLYLGGNDPLLRGAGVGETGADVSNGRLHFWPVALKIFSEHPLLGAGLDAFGVAFTRFDTWPGLLRVEQAHNEYLQILADAGISGFLCVAAFIVLLFKRGLRVISETHGYRQHIAVGALAGCFGIMVHSFFDFPLRTYSNSFFFLLLAAMATVPVGEVQRRRRRSTH